MITKTYLNKCKHKAFLLILVLTSANGHTEESSILHLTNGEVINGKITEYNANKSEYRISPKSNSDRFIHNSKIRKIITYKNGNSKKSDFSQTRKNKNPQLKKKAIEIGISSMSIQLEANKKNYLSMESTNAEYSGISGSFQFAITDHIATRSQVYYAKIDNDFLSSSIDSNVAGIENQILLTTNSSEKGWKFHVGGTLFMEKWSGDETPSSRFPIPSNNTYTGLGFLYGMGYNFESISLDLSGSIRNKSAYDNINSVIRAGFTVAYRI